MQEEVAARIRQRFPDEQILFTRDLPEIYPAFSFGLESDLLF
jgi:hypothetical protein